MAAIIAARSLILLCAFLFAILEDVFPFQGRLDGVGDAGHVVAQHGTTTQSTGQSPGS
jgi:hypothetical protein